jgi:hypothetical protein
MTRFLEGPSWGHIEVMTALGARSAWEIGKGNGLGNDIPNLTLLSKANTGRLIATLT